MSKFPPLPAPPARAAGPLQRHGPHLARRLPPVATGSRRRQRRRHRHLDPALHVGRGPSGTVAHARAYDRNGLDIELREAAVRNRDDLHVVVNGSLLAIALDFFDTNRSQGMYHDMVTGQTNVWLRD
jgi:hypothetical protein